MSRLSTLRKVKKSCAHPTTGLSTRTHACLQGLLCIMHSVSPSPGQHDFQTPPVPDATQDALPHEKTVVHEGLDEGWRFTADDHERFKLLGVSEQELQQGIPVKLFQINRARPMPRISLRLLDSHLHAMNAHPTQLSRKDADMLISRKGLQKHVQDIVRKRLLQCAPVGPNPIRMQDGKQTRSAYSALAYITRQDLSIKDEHYGFDTHIFQNLVYFIKNTFFSPKYMTSCWAGLSVSNQQVTCIHVCNV